MHLYILSPEQEAVFMSRLKNHFYQTELVPKIASAVGLDPILFEFLGVKHMYDMSVHLLSLREQYPEDVINTKELSYRDWDNMQRVVSSWLYGLFTKWITDV